MAHFAGSVLAGNVKGFSDKDPVTIHGDANGLLTLKGNDGQNVISIGMMAHVPEPAGTHIEQSLTRFVFFSTFLSIIFCRTSDLDHVKLDTCRPSRRWKDRDADAPAQGHRLCTA